MGCFMLFIGLGRVGMVSVGRGDAGCEARNNALMQLEETAGERAVLGVVAGAGEGVQSEEGYAFTTVIAHREASRLVFNAAV